MVDKFCRYGSLPLPLTIRSLRVNKLVPTLKALKDTKVNQNREIRNLEFLILPTLFLNVHRFVNDARSVHLKKNYNQN